MTLEHARAYVSSDSRYSLCVVYILQHHQSQYCFRVGTLGFRACNIAANQCGNHEISFDEMRFGNAVGNREPKMTVITPIPPSGTYALLDSLALLSNSSSV